MSRVVLVLCLGLFLLPLLGCGDGGGKPSINADQDKPKTGDVRK
jgi:hypothetical protein